MKTDEQAAPASAWSQGVLAATLGSDHPLLPVAIDACRREAGDGFAQWAAHLRRFLTFIAADGRDPDFVDPGQVARYLDRLAPVGYLRGYTVLSRFYASAVRRGLIRTDPMPDVPATPSPLASRRLSKAHLRALLRATADLRTDPTRGLTAHRDFALLLLAAWRLRTPDQLAALRWGDADLGGSSLRLGRDIESLPQVILDALAGLRDALAFLDVEVVPDDAILCGLHPSVRRSWLGDERDLLAPLTKSGIYVVVKKAFKRAGLYQPRRPMAQAAFLSWLAVDDPRALGDLLANETTAQPARIPMRHREPVGRPVPSSPSAPSPSSRQRIAA